MRLDSYNPSTALPVRSSRPAAPAAPSVAPVTQPNAPAQPAKTTAPAIQPGDAAGEYIPARQGASQPVYGHANQALASYQSMASLPDADADGVFGVDLFV
ncbi:hypothetical protein [Pseudomonas sp. FME51]|uniref:hypothetical protein n=1 Tax=Pseudomonas sp. FME51 TaxID=2742609 RepID=UPI0018692580|nr:hypothetical protein [Pseudomonas sp. FME51]